MPSATPGRYQSRLFNFLNRQSHRFTNQCDRAVRHLKVAAVWGAQILLYPMYLLVQASLSVGRQLSWAAQAGWPQLKAFTQPQPQETPPAVDTPIQRVLSAVNSLELQVERLEVRGVIAYSPSGMKTAKQDIVQVESLDHSANLAYGKAHGEQLSNLQSATSSTLQPATPQGLINKRCVIQGVATLIETRTLVLVTVDNQILDILTPQQQQKLASKISWEMADLLRQWRLAQASERQRVQRLGTTVYQRRLLPPIRLFWQLMAWVQTSPVAIAANLFQESTLVSSPKLKTSQLKVKRFNLQSSNLQPLTFQPSNLQPNNLQPSTPIQGALAFLDRTVAELESHKLDPVSEAVVALSDRVALTLRDRTQKLLQRFQSITPERPDASLEASQPNRFRIQALIYAAIEYFFGRHRSNLSWTDSQEQQAISANPQGQFNRLSGYHSTAVPPVGQPSNLELADTDEPDPWLSLGDLYGNPEQPRRTQNPKSEVQLPEAVHSKTPKTPGNSAWRFLKRHLSLKQPPGKLAVPGTPEQKVEPPKSVVQTPIVKTQSVQRGTPPTRIKPQKGLRPSSAQGAPLPLTKPKTQSSVAVGSGSKSASRATPVTSGITTPSTPSSDTNLEPAHDWIETQATPNGYVKHPLEQFLEWLDTAMLYLEELVVKIWRWVRRSL